MLELNTDTDEPLNNMDPLTTLTLELPKYVIDSKKIEILESIGEGGFASVFKGIDRRNGNFVAIKQVFESRVYVDNFRRFSNEIRTMARCHCCCLTKLIGFTTTKPYSIITEFEENSSLDSQLTNKKKADIFTGTRLTKIAMGIAFGMQHVHMLGILHRDLKLSNILLDKDYNPKLCDFGIARFYQEDMELTRKIGTPIYIAPEVFTDNHYTKKADVYSYAILLYELSEKTRPFKKPDGLSVVEIIQKVVKGGQRPQFTDATPIPLRKLIESCWDADPTKRPEFSYIYEQFKSGKVAFPNTKTKDIKAYAVYLENDAKENQELIEEELEKDIPEEIVDREMEKKRHKEIKQNSPKPGEGKSTSHRKVNGEIHGALFVQPIPASPAVKSNYAPNSRRRFFIAGNVNDNPFLNDINIPIMSKMAQKHFRPSSISPAPQSPRIVPMRSKRPSAPTPECRNNSVVDSSTVNDGIHSVQNGPRSGLRRSTSSMKFESDEDILRELSDEKSHYFRRALNEAISITDIEQFEKFAVVLVGHVAKPISSTKLKLILPEIYDLMRKSDDYVQLFNKIGLYQALPSKSDSCHQFNLDIIKEVFSNHPDYLTAAHVQVLGNLLEKSPGKMLRLFSFYAKNFSKFSNPWVILDILLTKQHYVVNTEYGADLVRILFYLMQNYQQYSAQRGSHSRATFISCLDSSNIKTSQAAYKALMNIDQDLSYINFSTIIKHLSNDDLWKSAISLMLRSNLLPASYDLIKMLIDRAKTSSYAWILLLRLASNPQGAAIFANDIQIWQNLAKESPMNAFKLFVLVFTNTNLRTKISSSSEFSIMMKYFTDSDNNQIVYAIPSIITRSQVDIVTLKRLQEVGFISKLIKFAIARPNDIDANNTCIVILDTLARVGYCKEYIDYFKSLVQLLKEPKLYNRVLTVMVTLSFHSECAKALISLGLVPYFTSLKDYDKYQALAVSFLKNASQYT